jgi:multiple sugar transport system permease protein
VRRTSFALIYPKKTHREKIREERAFWVFQTPFILGFIFFIGGPLFTSLYLSFTDYDIISSPQFVGLNNYLDLINDGLFVKSLSVTLYYTSLAVPFTIASSLLLAILLNQKVRGQAIFRTFFYAPSLVSGVSVALLWVWILNPQFGIVNSLIRTLLGVDGPGWFTDTRTVIPSLVIMQLTGLGSTIVIFLASLQSLPKDLYESASLDGAGRLKKFYKITIPLISPVILFNSIIALINSLQVFTQVYVVTKGGPNYQSYVYVYYLYQTAFAQFRMGYASALAWVLFLIIALLTVLGLQISRKWVYYEYDQKTG